MYHSIILHGFQYFKLDGLFTIFCQLQVGGGWLGGVQFANLVNFNNWETFISGEKSPVFPNYHNFLVNKGCVNMTGILERDLFIIKY